MKKFNFFPVLLVALFMLCGFVSNAQYKSPAIALQTLDEVITNSNGTIAQNNDVQYSPSNAYLGALVVRVYLTEILMTKIKASQNVQKSIDDMYTTYVNSDPRTLVHRGEIDYLKTQLLN